MPIPDAANAPLIAQNAPSYKSVFARPSAEEAL